MAIDLPPSQLDETPSQLSALPETPVLDRKVEYGDFRTDLARNGFAVIKGVVSKEQAAKYVDQMHSWLESFELGYKRDDESTWVPEMLPVNGKGGLYNKYGVAHEQFMWSIREEPGIFNTFAKLWNTDELLVSYDGCNISVPHDIPISDFRGKPWPHVDQSPLRRHLHCIQGIINLAENGPNDGGLMVLHKSKDHYDEIFETFAKDMPEGGWKPIDGHAFTDEQIKWLEERDGAHWEKVCAGPGDLILWDSRAYGAPPKARTARVAAYVCFKPASMIRPQDLEYKKQLFHDMRCTSHDPTLPKPVPTGPFFREDGSPDKAWLKRQVPDKKPILSKRGLQLAGLEPY